MGLRLNAILCLCLIFSFKCWAMNWKIYDNEELHEQLRKWFHEYENWLYHDALDNDLPDPTDLFDRLHAPTESVSSVHQISQSILALTKDLISLSSRTMDPSVYQKDVSATLHLIKNLPPHDVRIILNEEGVIIPPPTAIRCNPSDRFRPMDGSCNNIHNPCWGKAEQPYQRWLIPQYANGVDEPRVRLDGRPLPSPREIYELVSGEFAQTVGTTYPYFNNLFMIWGQMISHETSMAPTASVKIWTPEGIKNIKPKCCNTSLPHPDCFPFYVTFDDSYFPSGHCMEFVRSTAYAYSPLGCSKVSLGNRREQVNQLTSFIDASLLYGSSDEEMRRLRERNGRGAKLLMWTAFGREYPLRNNEICKSTKTKCDRHCLMFGEKRAGENPVLGALHTLWSREHNRLVNELRHKGWDEETLFQEVRKIIGAVFQHITYNEYLPMVLGIDLMDAMNLTVPTQQYIYDPQINPTLYNGFSTVAFRYGHSMVDSRMKRKGKKLFGSPLLTQDFFSVDDFCNTWSDPVSRLLVGQAEQRSQKVDCLFTKELTNHLFAQTPDGHGLDLFSINIQRGRDHGIPPYNKWREACGLNKATDYSDLRSEMPTYIVERLEVAYGHGHVDDIDFYVGGISEYPVNKGILGPTFTCVVANQFKNLKFGDRFWYENMDHVGAFTSAEIHEIRKTTFAGLLCQNSQVNEIQRMAFITEGSYNPKVPCSTIIHETRLNLDVWK